MPSAGTPPGSGGVFAEIKGAIHRPERKGTFSLDESTAKTVSCSGIKMPRKKKTWMTAAPSRPSPRLPDSIKIALTEKANAIIENVLKPGYIKPPSTDNNFNYLVDIYSKWHRHYFYFCAKYNCPSPNAIVPSFETKFARLEYAGNERFNLSYMRHTHQWWELYQGLTMLECLKSIAEEPHFIP